MGEPPTRANDGFGSKCEVVWVTRAVRNDLNSRRHPSLSHRPRFRHKWLLRRL